MKYTQWLNEWLENYIRPSAKVRTYERYGQIVKLHFQEVFDDIFLQKCIKKEP